MRLRESFSRAETRLRRGSSARLGRAAAVPPGGDTLFEAASSNTTAWLTVHLGTMIFIPLLATVLFVVLRRFDGTAALVSRIALAVFAIVYLAFEMLVGIGVGLLVDTSAPEAVVDAYSD